MKLKHSKYGYFISCSGYPKCKNIKGVELNGEEIVIQEKHKPVPGVNCPTCNAAMVKRDGKFGPFYSCSEYPKCKGTRKVPFGKKCSKCSSDLYLTLFKDQPKLACTAYPNCKNIEDVPPGTKINWINPKKLSKKKYSGRKKIDKVLNK